MKKYNAERNKAAGERTIGEASVSIGSLLWSLQGRSVSHQPRGPKLIERTSSRKHYWVQPPLAAHLSLTEVSSDSSLEAQERVLVPIGTMVEALEARAQQIGGAHMLADHLRETMLPTHD